MTTELDAALEEIETREQKATKGPWLWNINRKHRRVVLEAQVRMFEIVMDFDRWGMGGAAPRFRRDTDRGVMMTRVEEFAVNVPGREHHADWYQTIDQPDANFIANARTDVPALLRALRVAIRQRDDELGEAATATGDDAYENAWRDTYNAEILSAIRGEA